MLNHIPGVEYFNIIVHKNIESVKVLITAIKKKLKVNTGFKQN